MAKGSMKDLKEKPQLETTSRKKATRGKTVKLHKYWKGIASTILDKAERRHFLNMCIDAYVTADEFSRRRHSSSDKNNEAK